MPSPTRRAVLSAGALGLAAAACTQPSTPAAPAPVDPDRRLLETALERERALLAAYDTALAAHPSLTARLAPLRAEHAEHARALGAEAPEPTASPAAAAPVPSTGAAQRAALARLAALERQAASEHAAAATSGTRRVAPLLASLAASEAAHQVVL